MYFNQETVRDSLIEDIRYMAAWIVSQECTDYQIIFCAYRAGIVNRYVAFLDDLSMGEISKIKTWMDQQF